MRRGAWMLLLGLLAAGCQIAPVVREPQVQVMSVKLIEQTRQGAKAEASLELFNPNAFALPLLKSQYTFKAQEGGNCSLTDDPRRTLPARGRQRVILPIVLGGGGDLLGQTYRLEGAITYEPPGELRRMLTQTLAPWPSVRFSHSGRVE